MGTLETSTAGKVVTLALAGVCNLALAITYPARLAKWKMNGSRQGEKPRRTL
jgi:hypothetical protein